MAVGSVAGLSARLSALKGQRREAERAIRLCEDALLLQREEERILVLVGELFRQLLDSEIHDNVRAAERLLSEGLAAIFPDQGLGVRADVEAVRGKVSVDLVTTQVQAGGISTEGPALTSYGGSVGVVESVLLRVVLILKRGLRPILLLDESLAAVAEQYVPRVGSFLRLLCERAGIDILVVTHNPILADSAHRAYRIRKEDGESTFVEVPCG